MTKSFRSAMAFGPLNEHIRKNKELIQRLNETSARLWCSDCLLHSTGKLIKSNIENHKLQNILNVLHFQSKLSLLAAVLIDM